MVTLQKQMPGGFVQSPESRQYQQQAFLDLRLSVAQKHRAPLFVLPTGGGKTHVAKDLTDSAVAKGGDVLFLAPRRELIFQTSDKLTAHGISHGVIMAGEPHFSMQRVQVASIPTLHARAVRRDAMPFPNAKLVIVDEAHLARGRMTMDVLARYPNAVKVGLTATPCRTDGKGLGEIFDDLVLGPSVQELIDDGYLVQPRYYVPSKVDLTGVRMSAGDYNTKDLQSKMDSKTIIGDLLSNWMRLARNRKTVIFTVNVAHSLHVESVFREAGIRIAHIDAQTEKADRKDILKRLRRGELEVVTNCDVLTLGWDEPSVSCVALARPTKSLVRYMQAVGRALRPFEGKADCLVLDHGNCVQEHGLVEDDHEWSLTLDGTVQERDAKKKATAEKQEPKRHVCKKCGFVFTKSPNCLMCGWKIPHHMDGMTVIDDDLAELSGRKPVKREWTQSQQDAFLGELKHVGMAKGYKSGWAAAVFKERFGRWPQPGANAQPRQPSAETTAWLKYLTIRKAKSRAKQAQMGVAA